MSENTKFWLSEIIGIENYFHQEINQWKLCSKNLSKYVTAFDYIDKILIALSATSSGVCIISSASVVESPVWVASASFTLIFFCNNRNNQKITDYNKKQEKKHDKILLLRKSKLDSIQTLPFQALIDMEISHEELNAIIREKKNIWEDERKCE